MSTEMSKIDRLQFMTDDPWYDVPALTTLLIKVCDNDTHKFQEACRLLGLFMQKVEDSHNAR